MSGYPPFQQQPYQQGPYQQPPHQQPYQQVPYQQGPGMPPPPGPPDPGVQRRGGCRGCFVTCLTILVVCAVLVVIAAAAGIYMVRQMAPNAASFGDSAKCVALRIAVQYGETAIEQGDASAAEKAELRRNLQELQSQFEGECGPLR
jgi:hypothetical protein